MKIECLHGTSGMASRSYIVYDNEMTASLLIDPSLSPDTVSGQRHLLPPIVGILLTHAHFDHILALNEWKKLLSVPLYVGKNEDAILADGEKNLFSRFGYSAPIFPRPDVILCDGDNIPLGRERLKTWILPGHTAGSVAYIADIFAVTGDLVFAGGGYGRVDFPTGNITVLRESVTRLFTLPDNTVLYPGHGASTDVKTEKELCMLF